MAIDFVGTVGGVAFPGGTAENYMLELGSGRFIPGFEDQLVGAKAGEARAVAVTFPADYGNADLAGKAAEFEVTVRRSARDGAAGDRRIRSAISVGMENLEELRKAVREQIEREYDRGRPGASSSAIARRPGRAADDFPVPEGMVEIEFDQHLAASRGRAQARRRRASPIPKAARTTRS